LVVAFSRRVHFFVTTLHKSMAPQILNFSVYLQWRCPTSVAPDATSSVSLRMFWLFRVLREYFSVPSEKMWFRHIFRSAATFSDRWRLLAGQSRAPVNWDRWAAPDEQLVYLKDKPNCSRGIERSEHSPGFFPRVFCILWWRECCQNFVRHSILGLFWIFAKFLDISSAIFGFSAFETASEVSKFWCYTYFV